MEEKTHIVNSDEKIRAEDIQPFMEKSKFDPNLVAAEKMPPGLWNKLKEFSVPPSGIEALRPFLSIIAQELFNELYRVTKPKK